MKIKKDGSVIFNSIDNTGSTDEASLGARYAKGRLDSTENNLHQNYYTKEEVQELISGMGRTKIVSTLFEDWYIYVPEEEATEEEIYYHVNNSTIISEPSLDDLPTYYRQWKIEGGEVVPVLWFISCAKDEEIVEGQTYYTISLFGPTTKSTVMNNYVKAKIQVENNTYYFVGNDDDGYILYYYDADFKEAIIGNFEIDFSQYAVKETTIGSYTLENDITAQNIQDDIKDLTAEFTNKTLDADDNIIKNIETANFKSGVVKTSMPETPVDTELLSAKAIDEAKQDKFSEGTAISEIEDETTISSVDLENNEVAEATAKAMFEYIAKKIYPVGAIYISVDSTSPGDIFGGTWSQISDGYYLRASSDGGGNTLNEELPNVKGGGIPIEISNGSGNWEGALKLTKQNAGRSPNWTGDNGWGWLNLDASKMSNSVYKDNGKVQPKSVKVYMWKRTA